MRVIELTIQSKCFRKYRKIQNVRSRNKIGNKAPHVVQYFLCILTAFEKKLRLTSD